MNRLFTFLILLPVFSVAQTADVSIWKEGFLDIHHISTGSGNATFFIFPDGTTMLFDAGDVDRESRLKVPNPLKASPKLPNDSVSAGKCIVNYIKLVLPNIKSIDYAVISHFHTDHYGSFNPQLKLSEKGMYFLSGIAEVNEYLPIKKIIDRNYPGYKYPVDVNKNTFDKLAFENYLNFVNSQVANKSLKAEALKTGSTAQIRLKNKPKTYTSFQVRNVKCNGEVWSGKANEVIKFMPSTIPIGDYNENPLSIALKISYGKFNYFTGGDMTGLQGFGLPKWFDLETPVARVVGKVEALSLNHHGVRDATNEYFLKTLAPEVIVQQSWASNHPGEEVLHRMISPFISKSKKDIFATYIHDETITTYGRWLNDNYQSKRGHVMIRVLPKSNSFYVYILEDTALFPKIIQTFGPYDSE